MLQSHPRLYALFQQRIPGDEALLRLARLRFEQAGLSAEMYADTVDDLERALHFSPDSANLPTVHLSRALNILRQEDRDAVARFIRRYSTRVSAFIVHDNADMPDRLDDLVAAASKLDAILTTATDRLADEKPYLFIEYAAGCELNDFVEMAHRLQNIAQVSLCLDIGHIGIREARRQFARLHPGLDLSELGPQHPLLPSLVEDVQTAVAAALPAVLEVTRALAGFGKRLHYHLHDGHPLISGLPDHFGFLTRLALPFWSGRRKSLTTLYGPSGMREIVRLAVECCGAPLVSFALEIHQAEGQLPLGDAADLFRRWRDTRNAERMNYWLSVLSENALLITAVLQEHSKRE